ncbi:MAG: hypothetical protein ABIY90_17510 [Puia sp.]
MNGMLKTGVSVFARIMDFAFSGYGLVCDVVFLKLMFQHVGYRYISWLQFWKGSRMANVVNNSWMHLRTRLSAAANPADSRMYGHR